MAYDIPVLDISVPTLATAASLATEQFHAVVADGAGNAELAHVQGAPVMGILQNDPAAGQVASIRVYGVSKAVAGAAVTQGQLVESNATGELIPVVDATASTTTGALTGGAPIGIALDSVTAAGEIFSLLLTHTGAVPGTAA